MARRENDLGRDPVGKLLLRLAVPTVTAQLVNALYNIVDRIYIGHIQGVGDLALTGLGVCFPVILFVSAISILVGLGGASRAVVRMGEGKLETANTILGSCTTLLVVLGLAATVFFLLVQEPMLYLFGATENTIGYAKDYLTIYLYGSIFVELSMGLNYFITSQGFSTMGMLTVIIGAIINIVLDPVFIFGFGMGVQGAALATILAQAVSAIWVVRFLMGRRTKLRLQRRYLRLNWKVLAPVLALGVSPFIMQATESLVNIAFNSSLKAYGGDPAVGAMTICSSIMQVFSLEQAGVGGDRRVGPAHLCRRHLHAGGTVLLSADLRRPGPDPHLPVPGPVAQGDPPHSPDLHPPQFLQRQGVRRVPGRAGGRHSGRHHHRLPVLLALPPHPLRPSGGAGPENRIK